LSMSIPPITVVVIAMLWLGVGSGLVVCFASVMLAPIVYVNTIKGFDLVDDRLLEMATLYRFSLSMRVRRVYIPALTVPLSAAAVQVVCNAVRVKLLAEVIGSNNGMGAQEEEWRNPEGSTYGRNVYPLRRAGRARKETLPEMLRSLVREHCKRTHGIPNARPHTSMDAG